MDTDKLVLGGGQYRYYEVTPEKMKKDSDIVEAIKDIASSLISGDNLLPIQTFMEITDPSSKKKYKVIFNLEEIFITTESGAVTQ